MKNIYFFILSLFLFACFSCEEEERGIIPSRISVKHMFDPVITEMTSSSPICLPDGISFESNIINSKQELTDYIPSDIIKQSLSYENIDFANSSLLSLKFRAFYKPYKIEYKISKSEEGQVFVKQMFFVVEPMHVSGYFVMSNLVTDKLDENDKISFEQSFTFVDSESIDK